MSLFSLRNVFLTGALIGMPLALLPQIAPLARAGTNPTSARIASDTSSVTLRWKDMSGNAYSGSFLSEKKATVFLFTSTQCPIAGKYASRMGKLAEEYRGKGVAFFLVNSNTSDSAAVFGRWASDRKLTIPLVKDEGTALADALGVNTTPEAAVVLPDGTVAYRGRIDDSVEPGKVTRREVAEALEDVLAGRPVRRPRILPTGCAIFRDSSTHVAAVTSRYTFHRDVLPILDRNCVSCHREGDVAPFPLETYAQARPWASAIKEYTARRIMPPWKATPGHGEFLDARYLSDQELKTLAEWADAGAPEGNRKDRPAPATRTAVGAWALGPPDVTLKPAKPFRLDADGPDVYRNFTLPLDFEKDRFVEAFDFRPGNRAIVHHMIAYIDTDGKSAEKYDNKEAQPGWSVSGGGSGIDNEDWGDGWAPGMNPRRLAPGIAVRIPKGAKLVLQVHYHKSGKPEVDQSEVAVYYAKSPVKQVLKTFPLANYSFVLKPNVSDQVVKASLVAPFDLTLHHILPHMHMLGTEMKVWATLPDGTEKPLIYIQNWDFNWQMNYRYKAPVQIPKGSRVSLLAKFDNTIQNRNQPSNPPKEVRFGEQTTDEMCIAFLGFTIDPTNRLSRAQQNN